MNVTRHKQEGGIVVETLIVLAVIALLILIAIPVYLDRAEDAKMAQAQAEVLALAEAEQTVARVHGFYVPLQMLDDLDGTASARTATTDDLANEPDTIYLIHAGRPAADQIGAQPSLASGGRDVAKLKAGWQGPFYESKRISSAGLLGLEIASLELDRVEGIIAGSRSADEAAAALESQFELTAAQSHAIAGDPFGELAGEAEGLSDARREELSALIARLRSQMIRRDYPLDPWGAPYRFYSPAGIIGSSAADPDRIESDEFSDGVLTESDTRFDTYAIVSYGPDGLSDKVSGNNDDVIQFLFMQEGRQ